MENVIYIGVYAYSGYYATAIAFARILDTELSVKKDLPSKHSSSFACKKNIDAFHKQRIYIVISLRVIGVVATNFTQTNFYDVKR